MLVIGPRNIARAPRARAAAVERFVHRGEHLWMLAHAEIIIRAPHGNVLNVAILGPALGMGKLTGLALEFGEDAVVARLAKTVELFGEYSLIIHHRLPTHSTTAASTALLSGLRDAQRHILASLNGLTRNRCSTTPRTVSPASKAPVADAPLPAGAASAAIHAQAARARPKAIENGSSGFMRRTRK